MPKRKLNRRQSQRIEKNQKQRLSRADQRQGKSHQTENERLGEEQYGTIVAHYGANLDVEDQDGVVHHCLTRANLPKLVCGDRVVWQSSGERQGIIVSLVPRKTELSRPDSNKLLKPVAANIDQILVVSAIKPGLDEDIINRYLVAAHLTGISPIIVFNKIDLCRARDKDRLATLIPLYEHLGYPVLCTSATDLEGVNNLQKHLINKTSIFVGQSGVGKSSLINLFIPNAQQQVGELSSVTGLGKHTTTVTVMYHMDKGGNIIDSPGVREFGLDHLSPEQLSEGFVEFKPFLGLCKFKDCGHMHEPDCAVDNAVNSGEISPQRFRSFQRLVKSLGRR